MSFKGFEYIFHEKMYVIEVIAENRVGILWSTFHGSRIELGERSVF